MDAHHATHDRQTRRQTERVKDEEEQRQRARVDARGRRVIARDEQTRRRRLQRLMQQGTWTVDHDSTHQHIILRINSSVDAPSDALFPSLVSLGSRGSGCSSLLLSFPPSQLLSHFLAPSFLPSLSLSSPFLLPQTSAAPPVLGCRLLVSHSITSSLALDAGSRFERR